MESPRIGLGTGTVLIDQTHTRQASRPRSFEDAMRSGVSTLLKGAEVAGSAIGGPVLSSAIRGMRRDVELGGRPPIAYPPLRPGTGGAAGMAGAAGAAGLQGALAGATGVDPGTAVASAGQDPSIDAMRELQKESHDYNLDLLMLQESTQRENREFTTVSNTIKALHDTAKAAIGNLHA